eukprot:COSAG01_NODE_66500_length_270_cov_0.549708_2_plen_21_part_01
MGGGFLNFRFVSCLSLNVIGY